MGVGTKESVCSSLCWSNHSCNLCSLFDSLARLLVRSLFVGPFRLPLLPPFLSKKRSRLLFSIRSVLLPLLPPPRPGVELPSLRVDRNPRDDIRPISRSCCSDPRISVALVKKRMATTIPPPMTPMVFDAARRSMTYSMIDPFYNYIPLRARQESYRCNKRNKFMEERMYEI